MYKTLFHSHFDYCDVIYHIPSKQDQFDGILNSLMEKAERIQYQAAFAITGAWRDSKNHILSLIRPPKKVFSVFMTLYDFDSFSS